MAFKPLDRAPKFLTKALQPSFRTLKPLTRTLKHFGAFEPLIKASKHLI